MSESTSAADAASSAGSATSNLATVGDASSVYGQAANIGGDASAGTSGFSLGNSSTATTGPMETGPQMTGQAATDYQTYGTTDPSWLEKTYKTYEDFSSGGKQNMKEAYNNFGNNAKTYGYLYAKAGQLIPSSGGTTVQPASITVNNTYPENTYLKKYVRRY